MVCNAASNPYYGPMAGITDEAFAKILSNNIISNNTLANAGRPRRWQQRKDGAIIIISSIGGLRASTVIGAYCISKAADVQLARNLAAELGPHNIRVNCISPGLVKTDFAKALWEDQDTREQREEETPLRRLGVPDDIAGAAVFLASKAGSWTTGQNIVVDGGVTAVLTGRPALATRDSLRDRIRGSRPEEAVFMAPHSFPVVCTDEEWRKRLTPEQYAVDAPARHRNVPAPAPCSTRSAPDVFACAGCDTPLFESTP